MEKFEAMLAEVERGKEIIESYVNDCNVEQSGNKAVLLFPDDDSETLRVAYKYIDLFMKDYDYAIIIASINVDEIRRWTNKKIFIKQVNTDDMLCALRYASMVMMKTISLSMPYNHKAMQLVGFKEC